MKSRTLVLFLLAALTLTLLAGCQSANVDTPTTGAPRNATPLADVASATDPQWITPQEAEAIALAHAEILAENARMDRTEADIEGNWPHYDVEFHAGDYEYDYEIDAATGAVVRWKQEYEPVNAQPATPGNETQPAGTQPITAAEAEAIALAHAGLQRENVRFDRTEPDRERGGTEYEVEFRCGNWEYSYDIDADTGRIIDHEKEWDD